MPSVKISALPQITTSTIYDIVPVVDSGFTTTSKITLSDMRGLTNGTGSSSILSSSALTLNAAIASAPNAIALGDNARATSDNTISIGLDSAAGLNNAIALGYGASASTNNTISIGTVADVQAEDGIAIGNNSEAVGLSGATAVGSNAQAQGQSSLSLGLLSTATDSGATAVGAFSYVNGADNGIALGLGARTTGTGGIAIGNEALCEGGSSISIGQFNRNRGNDSICIGQNAILNSNSGICIGKNAQGSEQTIAMGYNIINYSQQSVSIGTAIQHQSQVQGGITIGYANDMLDNGGGNTNVLIGYDRTMRANGALWIASNSGTWVDYSNDSVMFGGRDNLMSGSTSIIINGSGNTASNLNTAVIGGTGNTASLEGSMMLNTFDRTSVYENTIHAENSHTFKTETFSIVDAGSVAGSVDVPCEDATIFKFTLTGDTTPNFVNPRTGQRFIFIVTNTTYNVPGALVNGTGSLVYAKNGTISPSNNGVTKYTATFDGTYMYLDEESGFSLV